ncbi:MAG: hypothetical protein K0Q87_2866 [Neobacillus sp.]|jgi:hypothetical protein|nr:hypothetical protein [Neobacillus sp.]
MKILILTALLALTLFGLSSCDKHTENQEKIQHNHAEEDGLLCLTKMPSAEEIERKMKASAQATTVDINQPVCINVFFHIVRPDNGIGGLSQANLTVALDSLNRFFNRHGIYLRSSGSDFINNSQLFDVDTETEQNQLFNVNKTSNAIDIYFVNTLGYGTGGVAQGITSKAFIVTNNHFNDHVPAHEMGHCLDLWHTFQGTRPGTSGCAENKNGSNCTTCGDYVCDTPADDSYGTLNGFSPNFFNVMSYYARIGSYFTDGQKTRMKTAILNSTLLNAVRSTACTYPVLASNKTLYCSDTENLSFTLQNGGNNVTWRVSNNATIVSQSNNALTIQPNLQSSTSRHVWAEAVLPFQTIRKEFYIGTPRVALTGYCTDNNSSYCHLNWMGFPVQSVGQPFTLSMLGQGDTGVGTDYEWEKVDGNFIFTSDGGYQTNPVNNGTKNIGKTATIKANSSGSSSMHFKIRAKNGCGFGQSQQISFDVH